MLEKLKKFLRDAFTECLKSPNGRHDWQKLETEGDTEYVCRYCSTRQSDAIVYMVPH